MTKTPNRTRPLDRDGDGRDGGSLPGNQTAPMAPAEAPAVEDEHPAVDDLADARTTPGDSAEKLEAIEREVDKANADNTPQPWNRDNDLIALKLIDLGVADDTPAFKATIENWSDDDARAAEIWADLRAAPGAYTDSDGEWLTAHGDLILTPDALAPILFRAADLTDTFTAEEVAAAMAQVIEAEGEAPAVDAEPIVIPADDPLVQIETETAPIAVRARELRLLLDARRLYKSKTPSGDWGYSSNYGAPYVDEATVQGWIAAGLADDEPTAGTWGGVKPTHEARRQLGLIVHGAAD